VILRGSYSQTIGRPGWADIQGGRTLDQIVRVDGGTGTQGDPTLKPLVSDNFDLSLEWYYGESSYVSAGWFRKDIKNYIGTTQIIDVGGSDGATPFNLHTPVGGAYWNAALAGGCIQADVTCIRNYIFANFNGQPGVTATGQDANGNFTGTINGLASDPLASFKITSPANREDSCWMAGSSTSSTCSGRAGSASRRTTPSSTARTSATTTTSSAVSSRWWA
jgi:hypothetical protein